MVGWLLLLAALGAGFAAARAAWPAPRRWAASDPLRLALAPLLGLGLASLSFFVIRVALGLPAVSAVVVFCAASAGMAALAWWRAGSRVDEPETPAAPAPQWLWVCFWLIAAMSAVTVFLLYGTAPHGEWDAWSIWNLRARFLFRAERMADVFSPLLSWSHPDYPLFVPGAVAFFWTAGGGESMPMVAAIAFLLLLPVVAVPVWVLRRLRGWTLALTAGICVMGATSLARLSGALYADVPLAACMIGAVSLTLLSLEEESQRRGPLLVAGCCAGLAAWTKNEGVLFALILLAVYALCATGRTDARQRLRTLPFLIAGMLPVLIVLAYFKLRLAPPNDLLNAGAAGRLSEVLLDGSRLTETVFGFFGRMVSFGNSVVSPFLVLGLWLFLVRIRPGLKRATLIPLVVCVAQLAGYFLVLLIASKDLNWQVTTAADRLLIHVWPVAVFGVLLVSPDIPPAVTKSAQLPASSVRSRK